MNKAVIEQKIDSIIRDFWDKDYDEIFLSMAGLADIWEGYLGEKNAYSSNSLPTILGIKIYNDKIFIAQGGGLQTFIKVLSPNGIQIYDLGSQLTLMTHTAMDVYGSMAVINDHEIVLGYMYINLSRLFMAPYGIDLATLWDNPSVKIVTSRVNDTSWVVMIRDYLSWRGMLVTRESPEDCLPCETKKRLSKNKDSFECEEIKYGRHALVVKGFTGSREDVDNGVSLSVAGMNGMHKLKEIQPPENNDEECLKAIDQYVTAFNRQKISPKDVGLIGRQISNNCSRLMYTNMLEIIEYKQRSHDAYIDFAKQFVAGTQSIPDLINECKINVTLISTMLASLSELDDTSSFLRTIFRDKIWWGPIWFIANRATLEEKPNINPYRYLDGISYESFIDTIKSAGISATPEEAPNLPMGWIVMARKGRKPVKYGRESMTYYRFPFAICTSTRTLFEIDAFEFNTVCEIETRADGMIVWAWDDRSTLWNKMWMRLVAYKLSNDGVFKKIDQIDIGYTMSPMEDSAKSVGIAEDNSYWIVRDYYLKDSINGGIGYVETKVDLAQDMKELYDTDQVSPYANINEISGMEGQAKGTVHYSNGMLEHNWEKYDLDDDRISRIPAWGNNGASFDFVSGYTGYQIHVSGEL